MEKRSVLAFSFIFILGTFFRLLNLQYFHALDTDEAIYAQIVFAMTKGYTLYSKIGFVHPPVYPILEYPFVLISPTLATVRLFNVAISLAIVFVVFFLCKIIYSEKVALLASAIYSLYPLAIYSNKLALIENSLTFFVTLTFCLFAKYVKEKHLKYLILSGFFAGVSFMTKYTALLFVVALVSFAVIRVFKKNIKLLFLFAASAIVVPLTVLFSLLITGLWPYFFLQPITWQLIRFGMPLAEKFWFFSLVIASLLPLILVAALHLRHNIGDWRGEMVMSWFFLPLVLLAFSEIVFLHYGFSLMPPIAILAALSIARYIPGKFRLQAPHIKSIRKIAAAFGTIILILIVIGRFVNVLYGIQWFFVENVLGTERESEYARIQVEVSSYIKSITNPNDKVWSSDASFGFLSQRLLVPPNSEYWKFQGFFQDVWGYGWSPDDYRGPIPGYPNGLFSLQDILRAWENERPKVIVIIKTSWVDYFVWYGINNSYHNEEGLASYIESHYVFSRAFSNIEIWVRTDS
jgi:4-amino-4-deoxy-L-arabinose transferase-like glycosyltransferase